VKKYTCLRNSKFSIQSSAVQISTTWGSIGIELINGNVIRCSLPRLAEQPEIPFKIISSGDDVVSTFIKATLSGKPAKMPTKTQTYGELARAIGRPRSYRAVANACGKNPAPLFIPCHRVVAANGKIGGFSAGLAWKRLLLATNPV